VRQVRIKCGGHFIIPVPQATGGQLLGERAMMMGVGGGMCAAHATAKLLGRMHGSLGAAICPTAAVRDCAYSQTGSAQRSGHPRSDDPSRRLRIFPVPAAAAQVVIGARRGIAIVFVAIGRISTLRCRFYGTYTWLDQGDRQDRKLSLRILGSLCRLPCGEVEIAHIGG